MRKPIRLLAAPAALAVAASLIGPASAEEEPTAPQLVLESADTEFDLDCVFGLRSRVVAVASYGEEYRFKWESSWSISKRPLDRGEREREGCSDRERYRPLGTAEEERALWQAERWHVQWVRRVYDDRLENKQRIIDRKQARIERLRERIRDLRRR